MTFLVPIFEEEDNSFEIPPQNGINEDILAEGNMHISSVEYKPIAPIPGTKATIIFHIGNTGANDYAYAKIKINGITKWAQCHGGIGECAILPAGEVWNDGVDYTVPSGPITVEIYSYHWEGIWKQDDSRSNVLNANKCTSIDMSVDKTEVYNNDDVVFTITRAPALAGVSCSVKRGSGVIGTCSTDSSGKCTIRYRMALPLGTYNFLGIARDVLGNIDCVSAIIKVKVIDRPAAAVSFTVNDKTGNVDVAKGTNFKIKVKGKASTTYGLLEIGLLINDLLKEGQTDTSGNWEFDYNIDKNETIDIQVIEKCGCSDWNPICWCDKSNKIKIKVGDGGGGDGKDVQILIDDKSGTVSVGKGTAFKVKITGAASTTYGFFEAGLVTDTLLAEKKTDATGNAILEYTINEDKTIDVAVKEKCGGILCKQSNIINLIVGKGACGWTDVGCSVGRTFGVDPLIVYGIVAIVLILIILVMIKVI